MSLDRLYEQQRSDGEGYGESRSPARLTTRTCSTNGSTIPIACCDLVLCPGFVHRTQWNGTRTKIPVVDRC